MKLLIHSASPHSRPVVIIVLTHVVRTFVSTFQNLAKQVETMFTTGEIVDLAEWIIDDTCFVSFAFALSPKIKSNKLWLLIHEADQQSRPVVITIFTHVVRMLAEWIIDDLKCLEMHLNSSEVKSLLCPK